MRCRGIASLANPAGVGMAGCGWPVGAVGLSSVTIAMPSCACMALPMSGASESSYARSWAVCAALPGGEFSCRSATASGARNIECGPAATAHSTGIFSKPKMTRHTTSAGKACRLLRDVLACCPTYVPVVSAQDEQCTQPYESDGHGAIVGAGNDVNETSPSLWREPITGSGKTPLDIRLPVSRCGNRNVMRSATRSSAAGPHPAVHPPSSRP